MHLKSLPDNHTVAGFVLARSGRIRKAGASLTWRELRIEVIDMDRTRIDKLLIALLRRAKTK